VEGDGAHRLAARLSTLAGGTVAAGELRVAALGTVRPAGWRLGPTEAWGKHLLTRIEPDLTLHTHLRMDGSWTILGPGKVLPRRLEEGVRVRLALADGRTAVALNAPVVELVRSWSDAVGHLGPDPLRPDWDQAEAVRRLRADPDRPLVEALLDQRTVSGLGNLWAVELCFLRGHHPWTPVGGVEVAPLLTLARRMLRHSLDHGTHMTTTGDTRPGRSHWVYGRAGRPCLRCGTAILFRPDTGRPYERETWWCPHCQPRRPAPAE
jgi:endonuclease-8